MLPVSLSYAERTDAGRNAQRAPAPLLTTDVLATLSFGDGACAVPLLQLDPTAKAEVWRTSEPVQREDGAGIVTACNTSVFFGYASEVVTGVDLEQITAQVYGKLFAAARKAGFPHPL